MQPNYTEVLSWFRTKFALKIAPDWRNILLAHEGAHINTAIILLDHKVCGTLPVDGIKKKARYLSSIEKQLKLLFDTPRHKRQYAPQVCGTYCRWLGSQYVTCSAGYLHIEKEPYQKVWFFF